jgi:hypothetical protein
MCVTKECNASVRCMAQCKECSNAKRISYYLTRCTITGKKVNRNAHKYCDDFAPTPAAKKEARTAGIKLTPIGGWIQGTAIPKGARVR